MAGLSVEGYLEMLVAEDEEWRVLPDDEVGADDEATAAEVRQALEKSFAQVECGEVLSLEEFDQRMRSRHGLPR